MGPKLIAPQPRPRGWREAAREDAGVEHFPNRSYSNTQLNRSRSASGSRPRMGPKLIAPQPRPRGWREAAREDAGVEHFPNRSYSNTQLNRSRSASGSRLRMGPKRVVTSALRSRLARAASTPGGSSTTT